ncbi:glutathione S-transferase Gst1 [Schizosaccharomyces pombe]|uniref:Glutathione S-transferase 1 n=1 Tax=Schizosaccharomyces pombe (strain 972 / ATCC 24843) TaxID=284812 RepID=GST1_SCHPO|nr:glutathione S-transferase Gst1 [Schizosaccharomyces pombe]Q9Y7Q2.1 RecName: Full=Glutathione S-transferase 1; AltName: Full=GST-I [Schizosaccharomyces pombe 972h-]AAF21054.1 glutathione S-transferase [Schizosaccharomyces pombe]CAB41055.1 glutathione S-transferase Gst1 [Schizosaccharomyces pombe]|eukprot:NP_588298.1 glutathione S-transferase Gst1 [Schizosaccharomyces pombe]
MAQFTLWSHAHGPNPWKVVQALKELDLTYETRYVNFSKNEQKSPEHLALNPNGRVPTLIDHHNNDYTIWESDAILIYLADKYDTERKISLPRDHPEYYKVIQYLFFQASGQGIIWGQAGWFSVYHQELVISAITRYRNEIKRVLGVLEDILKDRDYLVANRFTIADLSFISWNNFLEIIFAEGKFSIEEEVPQLDFEKEFPRTYSWHQRLLARPASKATFEERSKALDN